VYVAGSTDFFACYWKNNTLTKLSDGTQKAEAYGIQVGNNNVYTVGWIDLNAYSAASNNYYWKNSTVVTNPNTMQPAYIAVNGDDVYATGFASGSPVYWKNGAATTLPLPPDQYFSLTGMTVNGSDVYVSENTGYWKNTTFVPLTSCINTVSIIAVPQ
jgi:hypothetical protein